MKYKSVIELIGNTPIIEIDSSITGLKNVNLFVKCELYNPFGSMKDRTAFSMIKDDIDNIKKNKKIVIESSSGNTAKALQSICSINNIHFKTVTNRIKVPESKDILKIIGAEIEELPPSTKNKKIDPVEQIKMEVLENKDKYFHTDQYANLRNPKIHFEHTGKEIYDDIGNVDYFFSVLGTSGSSRGVIEYLLSKNENLFRAGIVSEDDDFIPGIRNKNEMDSVEIFNKNLYNKIISIHANQAIEGMITLIRRVGILAGPTSGASFYAAINYLKNIDNKLDHKVNAVFIACDRLEWYTSYIKKRRPDIFYDKSIYDILDEELKLAKSVDDFDGFINDKKPIIIDIRENNLYLDYHLNNSINMTEEYINNILEKGSPFSKDSCLLFICDNGNRSKKFSAIFNKKGFNTYFLSGGINHYKNF